MTQDSENTKRAFDDAFRAIQTAQDQGVLVVRSGLSQQALAMVRVEMLSQVLLFSRHGEWFRDSVDRADWEYAQVYGYLTRLAKFEISNGPDNAGWQYFQALFRSYFGPRIDGLAPSIFLAAVFHPDFIMSAKLFADIEIILRSMGYDEDADAVTQPTFD